MQYPRVLVRIPNLRFDPIFSYRLLYLNPHKSTDIVAGASCLRTKFDIYHGPITRFY